jgi:hypothetical protein
MTPEGEDVRPYDGPYTEDDLELFGAFKTLCRITVEGRDFWVPEGISVLRACQYIEMKERAVRMPWRDYCWNNTQGCCDMTYRETKEKESVVGRACLVKTTPGMELVRLPKGGRSCR